MTEFLIQYFTIDRTGCALAVLVIAATFTIVKRRERVRPTKESSDA